MKPNPEDRTFIYYEDELILKFKPCERCKLEILAGAERAKATKAANEGAERAKREAGEKARMNRLNGPLPPLSAATVQALAAKVAASADNNEEVFTRVFTALIRSQSPESDGPFVLHSSAELIVNVTGPVWRYGTAVAERVRKFIAAPAAVAWNPTYSVAIVPRQIDAPDIERVIVQRNGVQVSALNTSLKPQTMITKMGAKTTINAGVVNFPASAFTPDKSVEVKVTLIPAVGSSIVHVFTNEELHSIR